MVDNSEIYPSRIVGVYIEQYTVSANRIQSSILKNTNGDALTLKWARMIVGTTGNYTVKDHFGNSVTMNLVAGTEYQFPVSVVSAAAGTVWLLHDGEPASTQDKQ